MLLLPMAGRDGGDTFRALQTAQGETLVHRTLRSFAPFFGHISKVVGIVLKEDAARFDLATRLADEMHGLAFDLVTLDAPTNGPAETVASGAVRARLSGPAVICDIDHRLNVAPLFHAIGASPEDCLVSLWPLAGEELKRWSVACVGGNGDIVRVEDRRLPAGAGFFHGVVGCYYVPDIAATAARCREDGLQKFSCYFNALTAAGRPVRGIRLTEAEFFGDEERIRTLEGGAPRGTIFCDIDGTLIRHQDKPDYTQPAVLLPGSREKLQGWIAQGYHVVLCTARRQQDEPKIAAMLRELDIPHHRLVTGLPSGARVLINDRKPYEIFSAQASSLEIARDAGIASLEICPTNRPTVLRRFEGGSFAETVLLADRGKTFVRKRVAKDGNLTTAYQRLRDQFRTLERFAFMDAGLVPALLGEENNSHEYFYDMEFLAEHRTLADCNSAEQIAALDTLLDRFAALLYCQRTRNTAAAEGWLLSHLASKIEPKIVALREHEILRPLLSGNGVVIDGNRLDPLERLLSRLRAPDVLSQFAPKVMSPVHGDLTFQNIMVRPDGDVKAIDMEALEGFEATDLDLGKLFQSTHSRYEQWSRVSTPLCERTSNTFHLAYAPPPPDPALLALLRKHWSAILDCSDEAVEMKGNFYLGLHLVRMVPFRMQQSVDQASYALATALIYLNRAVAQAASRTGARVRRAA